MKIKAMTASALAALALTGAFASSAGASNGEFIQAQNGPIPAHTIQTPTGAMLVPDQLIERGTLPSGKPYVVEAVICGYASPEQASHYTMTEIEADPRNWCLREPGTVTPLVATASKHAKKAHQHKKRH